MAARTGRLAEALEHIYVKLGIHSVRELMVSDDDQLVGAHADVR